MAARLATRWGRGDYSPLSGESTASGRLIALYKDSRKVDVRPVCVGGALRRLLVKAQACQIREKIKELVEDHQLGVLKGGWEAGIHTMRAITKKCRVTNGVIMLLDFQNAFNTPKRNLLMLVTQAFLPEMARLVFWLYGNEPDLVTQRGDLVKSSSGTQQGCGLSNPLFALLIRWINARLQHKGLMLKLYYWDDAALVGTPEAVAWAAKQIERMETETDLKLRWNKCHVHCPSKDIAKECVSMFEAGVTIHDTLDMLYLKIPIGSDEYVARSLRKKLDSLKVVVHKIVEMPFKHEAYTLLRNCASECRVTHIMRTIPPRQSEPFIRSFDALLRQGFEKIMGKEVEDRWWRQAQLPPKYGGMGLRSGLKTLGAQHAVSLLKTAPIVKAILKGKYDVKLIMKHETEAWLSEAVGRDVDTQFLVERLSQPLEESKLFNNYAQQLSLAQLCELVEQQRVHELMLDNEKIHIESMSGPDHAWVTLTPLSHMKYRMENKLWMAAVRRRLRLDVASRAVKCPRCKWGKCDVKGDHAVACPGGSCTQLRHSKVRDLVAKAARDAGYLVKVEQGGALGDRRRPGDVMI